MRTQIGYVTLTNSSIIVEAWLEAEHWNGYAKPWFDKETALSIIDELNMETGERVYNSRVKGDDILVEDVRNNPGVYEKLEHFDRHGTEVYGLGNGSWSWFDLDNTIDLFEAFKKREKPMLISVFDHYSNEEEQE